MDFFKELCNFGIMFNVCFLICWDGKNFDFFDYMVYMLYFEFGIFEGGGFCLVLYLVCVF